MNFAASVSSPAFSATGSVTQTQDSDMTQDQQNTYLSSTTRSSILTYQFNKIYISKETRIEQDRYGGAPGAYGPSEDAGPSSFGDWAATVDLLPVAFSHFRTNEE